MNRMRGGILAAVCGLTACGSSDSAGSPDAQRVADAATADAMPATPDAVQPQTEFGGDRPATLRFPSGYDPANPAPLIVALHGYSTNTTYVVGLFRLDMVADSLGALLIAPQGTLDETGNRYWNATDACCDLYDQGTDDVAYLAGLADEIASVYAVDPNRIYVIGHSNGAFMALRLACDRADLIAGAISVAGAGPAVAADCAPSEPVSIVQIHAADDDTILYDGGQLVQGNDVPVAYPAATQTVADWASRNGCAPTRTDGADIDLVATVADAETHLTAHDGCPDGISTELWTAASGGHILVFGNDSPTVLSAWLAAHTR